MAEGTVIFLDSVYKAWHKYRPWVLSALKNHAIFDILSDIIGKASTSPKIY